nr:MAG TPA: hypothetical protein [Caudoviricetes sp.]
MILRVFRRNFILWSDCLLIIRITVIPLLLAVGTTNLLFLPANGRLILFN